MAKLYSVQYSPLAGERWRGITGWDYEVSNLGRVRRFNIVLGDSRGVVMLRRPGEKRHSQIAHLVSAAFDRRASTLTFGDALSDPMEEYLRKRCSPEPNSGCWLWLGPLTIRGYGITGHDMRPRLAHRFVYQRFMGTIPDGLDLDHKCRLPCCVNPDHLEPVTRAENSRRMWKHRVRNATKIHPI